MCILCYYYYTRTTSKLFLRALPPIRTYVGRIDYHYIVLLLYITPETSVEGNGIHPTVGGRRVGPTGRTWIYTTKCTSVAFFSRRPPSVNAPGSCVEKHIDTLVVVIMTVNDLERL